MRKFKRKKIHIKQIGKKCNIKKNRDKVAKNMEKLVLRNIKKHISTFFKIMDAERKNIFFLKKRNQILKKVGTKQQTKKIVNKNK